MSLCAISSPASLDALWALSCVPLRSSDVVCSQICGSSPCPLQLPHLFVFPLKVFSYVLPAVVLESSNRYFFCDVLFTFNVCNLSVVMGAAVVRSFWRNTSRPGHPFFVPGCVGGVSVCG